MTSFVVNQPMKLAGARRRPDRTDLGVPENRWVRAAAIVVRFSRVYTGVHYPGDVIAGAAAGALVGRVTSTVARGLRPSHR